VHPKFNKIAAIREGENLFLEPHYNEVTAIGILDFQLFLLCAILEVIERTFPNMVAENPQMITRVHDFLRMAREYDNSKEET
jgi:hypothetical protein